MRTTIRISRPVAERLEREARALGLTPDRLLETVARRFLQGIRDARQAVEAAGREADVEGARRARSQPNGGSP